MAAPIRQQSLFKTTFSTQTHSVISKDKSAISKTEKAKIQESIHNKFVEFLCNATDESDFNERKKAIDICTAGIQNAVNNKGYAETSEFGLRYVDLIMDVKEDRTSIIFKKSNIESPELTGIKNQLEVLAAHRNMVFGDKKRNFNFFVDTCYTNHMEILRTKLSNISFGSLNSKISLGKDINYEGRINLKNEPHGKGLITVGNAKDKIEYSGKFYNGEIISGGKLRCFSSKTNAEIEIYTFHFSEILAKDFLTNLMFKNKSIIEEHCKTHANMGNVLRELLATIKRIE